MTLPVDDNKFIETLGFEGFFNEQTTTSKESEIARKRLPCFAVIEMQESGTVQKLGAHLKELVGDLELSQRQNSNSEKNLVVRFCSQSDSKIASWGIYYMLFECVKEKKFLPLETYGSLIHTVIKNCNNTKLATTLVEYLRLFSNDIAFKASLVTLLLDKEADSTIKRFWVETVRELIGLHKDKHESLKSLLSCDVLPLLKDNLNEALSILSSCLKYAGLKADCRERIIEITLTLYASLKSDDQFRLATQFLDLVVGELPQLDSPSKSLRNLVEEHLPDMENRLKEQGLPSKHHTTLLKLSLGHFHFNKHIAQENRFEWHLDLYNEIYRKEKLWNKSKDCLLELVRLCDEKNSEQIRNLALDFIAHAPKDDVIHILKSPNVHKLYNQETVLPFFRCMKAKAQSESPIQKLMMELAIQLLLKAQSSNPSQTLDEIVSSLPIIEKPSQETIKLCKEFVTNETKSRFIEVGMRLTPPVQFVSADDCMCYVCDTSDPSAADALYKRFTALGWVTNKTSATLQHSFMRKQLELSIEAKSFSAITEKALKLSRFQKSEDRDLMEKGLAAVVGCKKWKQVSQLISLVIPEQSHSSLKELDAAFSKIMPTVFWVDELANSRTSELHDWINQVFAVMVKNQPADGYSLFERLQNIPEFKDSKAFNDTVTALFEKLISEKPLNHERLKHVLEHLKNPVDLVCRKVNALSDLPEACKLLESISRPNHSVKKCWIRLIERKANINPHLKAIVNAFKDAPITEQAKVLLPLLQTYASHLKKEMQEKRKSALFDDFQPYLALNFHLLSLNDKLISKLVIGNINLDLIEALCFDQSESASREGYLLAMSTIEFSESFDNETRMRVVETIATFVKESRFRAKLADGIIHLLCKQNLPQFDPFQFITFYLNHERDDAAKSLLLHILSLIGNEKDEFKTARFKQFYTCVANTIKNNYVQDLFMIFEVLRTPSAEKGLQKFGVMIIRFQILSYLTKNMESLCDLLKDGGGRDLLESFKYLIRLEQDKDVKHYLTQISTTINQLLNLVDVEITTKNTRIVHKFLEDIVESSLANDRGQYPTEIVVKQLQNFACSTVPSTKLIYNIHFEACKKLYDIAFKSIQSKDPKKDSSFQNSIKELCWISYFIHEKFDPSLQGLPGALSPLESLKLFVEKTFNDKTSINFWILTLNIIKKNAHLIDKNDYNWLRTVLLTMGIKSKQKVGHMNLIGSSTCVCESLVNRIQKDDDHEIVNKIFYSVLRFFIESEKNKSENDAPPEVIKAVKQQLLQIGLILINRGQCNKDTADLLTEITKDET